MNENALGLKELRTAIYQRLVADLAPIPVYPFVAPQGEADRYIVISRIVSEPPEQTKTSRAHIMTATIEIWAPAEDHEIVYETLDAILRSLSQTELQLEHGWREVWGMGAYTRAEMMPAMMDRPIIVGTLEYTWRLNNP